MLDMPLFQYAYSAGLIPLQKLAKDMKDHGVLYNNSLGERTLVIEKYDKDLFEQALLVVENAIAELHSDDCSNEERSPDFYKEIASSEPKVFFVKIDDDGNYMPHGLASHSTIPASEGPLEEKPPNKDSQIWRIAGFLLHQYVQKDFQDGNDSVDDEFEKIAYGNSTYIEKVRTRFNETQEKESKQDVFSEHVKHAASSYLDTKSDT